MTDISLHVGDFVEVAKQHAAKVTGRKAVGIELVQEYATLAERFI